MLNLALQIGVLDWCREFAEMVDMFEAFVFESTTTSHWNDAWLDLNLIWTENLFTATRDAALMACDNLIGLPLEISIKLIQMLLLRQIKRLRDLLDPHVQYKDWPDGALLFRLDAWWLKKRFSGFSADPLCIYVSMSPDMSSLIMDNKWQVFASFGRVKLMREIKG